ncbi:Mortality factor 4-like protein 2, partial [Borealophlyctis nickersoniae]
MFDKDDDILCYHGPLLYDAKTVSSSPQVLKTQLRDDNPYYLVHYKGWNNKWDDWVPEERTLEITPENLALQHELEKTYENSSPTKQRRMSMPKGGPSGAGGG